MKFSSKIIALAVAAVVSLTSCAASGSIESEPALEIQVLDEGSQADETLSSDPSSEPIDRDPEADPAESADSDNVQADSEPVANSDADEPTETTDGQTATKGDVPQKPDCEAGPRSEYEASITADVSEIVTNEIYEGAVESFTADHYLIDLCEGQQIIFDTFPGCKTIEFLRLWIYTPSGEKMRILGSPDAPVLAVYDDQCGGAVGPIEIPETGQYTIEIRFSDGDDSRARSYRFQVLNVAPADVFEIGLGDEIRPGSEPGMGSIEFPGSQDHYKVQLEEGQRIALAMTEECKTDEGLRLQIFNPDGEKMRLGGSPDDPQLAVYDNECGDSFGPIEIPETGEYNIVIRFKESRIESTARSYGFDLLDVSPSSSEN